MIINFTKSNIKNYFCYFNNENIIILMIKILEFCLILSFLGVIKCRDYQDVQVVAKRFYHQ